MKSIKPLLLFMVLALLASCAGFQPGLSDEDALTVIENLNNANAEILSEQTDLPFVLDGEILASDSQIRLLWTGLADAGYMIDNPVVIQQRPVQPSDAALFSKSWEIQTFFKNLLSEEDELYEIQHADGRIFMILKSEKKGSVRIRAWKGADA